MTLYILGTDIAYPQRVASGGLIKRVSDGKVLADIRTMGFVAIKATQGTTIKDAQWANSYAMARKFGKKVIAYHFNDNRVSVAAQVDFFLSVAREADAFAIDQEGDFGFTDAQTQQFVDLLKAKVAPKLVIRYHSASGFAGVNADGEWVADYRLESLQDGATTVAGWDIWQFSSEGGPDGAGLDLDYMKADSPIAKALGLDPSEHIAILDGTIRELNETVKTAKAIIETCEAENATLREQAEQDDAEIMRLNVEAEQVSADRVAAKRLLGIT